jgi:signal peptidase
MDDVDLYAHKQYYLDRQNEVIGAVKAYVPWVGYVTILLSENLWAKYALLAGMGFLAMVQRE